MRLFRIKVGRGRYSLYGGEEYYIVRKNYDEAVKSAIEYVSTLEAEKDKSSILDENGSLRNKKDDKYRNGKYRDF